MLNFTTTATSFRYWSDIIQYRPRFDKSPSAHIGREAEPLFVLGHLLWLDRRFSWSQMDKLFLFWWISEHPELPASKSHFGQASSRMLMWGSTSALAGRRKRRFVEGHFYPFRWITAGLFFVGSCTLYPFRCIDGDTWWIYIYYIILYYIILYYIILYYIILYYIILYTY